MADSIKVAVRVRPFISRELAQNARCVIEMEDGKTTKLLHPQNLKQSPKTFTFDHSYWSFDGFNNRSDGYLEPAGGGKYADQHRVFDDLGRGMLENAWQGYNATIFAYGQTGSGKSYSIMGDNKNEGIVPTFCRELFKGVTSREADGVCFEIKFSMIEIYNEVIRDLLIEDKQKRYREGLHLREDPKKGVYAEGMQKKPVGTYDDIVTRMRQGSRNRTLAATKMNEASSRAHTVVTIELLQRNTAKKTVRASTVNLVDLAGSERAKQTGAEGDRFKESQNINLSLMTLGSVIKGLCDCATGKKAPVPYRNSKLTRLLQNALGGNSRTVMLAAISPSDENYEQTLSTLRYADRAKAIKTKAVVNESAAEQMIRELLAEKERLLAELNNKTKVQKAGYSEEDIAKLKSEKEQEINRLKQEMAGVQHTWERQLEQARAEIQHLEEKEKKERQEKEKTPHLWNLNEDPTLSGKICHLLRKEKTTVGNPRAQPPPDIVLHGASVTAEHAVLHQSGDVVTVRPGSGKVVVNGEEVEGERQLQHQDRLVLGSNNLWVLHHPGQLKKLRSKQQPLREVTWEMAHHEIARKAGYDVTEDNPLLMSEVRGLLQEVDEANAMASVLQKPVEFEIVIVSGLARGDDAGRSEVRVKVTNVSTGVSFVWGREKFLDRFVLMSSVYQSYEEGRQDWNVAKEDDPFWEPEDTEVMVGVTLVPLEALAYNMDLQENVSVVDYRGIKVGYLSVNLAPVDGDGHEIIDSCVDNPADLVGNKGGLQVHIDKAINLPKRFSKVWCCFRFYNETDQQRTEEISMPNPKFHFRKKYMVEKVSHKLVDYYQTASLVIEVWGRQRASGSQQQTASDARFERSNDDLQKRTKRIQTILNRVGEAVGNDESDLAARIRAILDDE